MDLIALVSGDHFHLACATAAGYDDLDEVLTEAQVDERCGLGMAWCERCAGALTAQMRRSWAAAMYDLS
jgi:hypothetical protein